jgi:cytidyltransferase-like protein
MLTKEFGAAYTIGRFTPFHWGHTNYFKWLLSNFYHLVIGIGSCYNVGQKRHPLLAVLREKIILNSLIAEGVDPFRLSFVHLPDLDDWDAWWKNITSIPQIGQITHFVTGNEAEIICKIKEKGITPPFKLINPEKEMPRRYQFPFHASDLREAIIKGDYKLFQQIAASGTIALMSHAGGFNGMREAMEDRATGFVPGRQTVDMVVLLRKPGTAEPQVLCGYRSNPDKPFYGQLGLPGDAINMYENPMDAAVRALEQKTGIKAEIVARHLEPSHVLINGKIFDMRLIGLFSTEDALLSGGQGGSSQVFCIEVDSEIETAFYSNELSGIGFKPVSFILEEDMAYQQSAMLKRALNS